MNRRVLIVDDDANLIASLKRRLGRRFQVSTALSGEAGLELMRTEDPFAVVISDQRMTHMDGIRYLAEVKRLYPDCVRMMLTGNIDLKTAVDAINEAGAFRFLTKPCALEDLVQAIEDGLQVFNKDAKESDAALQAA